ncbi:NAD(P)H-dependent oxidoreductase [Pelotomaculum schinkii]|uniref:NAD(P)H-dependent oxidoreductase n=1 Tax=Pelotomaculum schinkii TaxID=78350 RepID=UPI001FAA46CC|nr:NAD(P)H-dependent oxidoreductase [Pelotomaculum schinkii]
MAELDSIDAIVIGSPVYYAGPTGQLTAFLDRLFFSVALWRGRVWPCSVILVGLVKRGLAVHSGAAAPVPSRVIAAVPTTIFPVRLPHFQCRAAVRH